MKSEELRSNGLYDIFELDVMHMHPIPILAQRAQLTFCFYI